MNHLKDYLLLLVFLFQTLLSFGQNPAHEQWKADRKTELLGENGWLNLSGLLWIDQEKAYLNQYSEDSLAVSEKAVETNIGFFQFLNDSVWFIFNPRLTKEDKVSHSAKTLQFPVEDYSQGGMYYDRWKWSVINRGGMFAVRIRDLKHPALAQFESIPIYDYDSIWRIDAFFEPRFNEFVAITNVLGQVIEWRVMGILKFEIQGQKQEIAALEDAGKLFVIFSDETNGSSTYPSGRYLHVDFPDKVGNTTIDFNYAYNPPCAFTAFATCPIPPKENRLNFQILAGEKAPEGH